MCYFILQLKKYNTRFYFVSMMSGKSLSKKNYVVDQESPNFFIRELHKILNALGGPK